MIAFLDYKTKTAHKVLNFIWLSLFHLKI